MGLKDKLHIGSTHTDMFDPDEQGAWKQSQLKIKEAARIAHVGQQKFQQADDHLSHAEAAKRDADNAARRQAELEQEAKRHLQTVESFKSKQPELNDARLAAARTAEEKAAAAKEAERELHEAEQAAHEKEHHLAGLKPQLEQHAQHHRSLEDKLAEHHRLTLQREEAHRARQAEHDALRKQHDANLNDVARLDKEHGPVRHEMLELEQRLAALRDRHHHSERALLAAKDKANKSHTRLHSYDPSEHNKALDALHAHKQREAELAAELAAAKDRAHHHQDLHERAMADHKAALEHHNAVRGKVSPIMQEVEEARAAQEAAERKLAEMEAEAKRSHGHYREHMGAANDHGRRAEELQAIADKHTKGYHAMRREGDDAIARKEKLWEEAKNHGDSGLSHFREKVSTMEQRLDAIGDKVKEAITGDKEHTHGAHVGHGTHSTNGGLEGAADNGHATHATHGSHTAGADPTQATHTTHGADGMVPRTPEPTTDDVPTTTGPNPRASAGEVAPDATAGTPTTKPKGLKGFFGRH